MSDSKTGQVASSAAQVYETFFVPALFANWAGPVCKAARVSPGDRVLDVACGTGVLAREAATRVGAEGRVTGIDINPGMIEQARAGPHAIDWHEGAAEDLPFDDEIFDAVVSQFGFMFFADREKALSEMWRVLAPGGRMVVAVWGSLEDTPGYACMRNLLDEQIGSEAAASLDAPYCLGDKTELAAIFERAGIADIQISPRQDVARFPSIAAWVHTDIRGWTLADSIDEEQYSRLLGAAERELQIFCTQDGAVQFTHPGLIVSVRKPG